MTTAEAVSCAICGPKGHADHTDDSYGACVLCREWVPHTDDEMVLVPWPCAVVRLARLEEAVADGRYAP